MTKPGLVELAEGLSAAGVRLLGSGGTAKKIRDANISIEHVLYSYHLPPYSQRLPQRCLQRHQGTRDARRTRQDAPSCRPRR
ncbi:hypothetical protein JVT61DRAFT_4144 [Boletus reticuloceps]|uniref:MGS-like domain-containing protein n=1 Tax=Boletus reticuloceps TaxID=495285 RepID=A0A8I3A7K6_9AGAM|nr:hypothetical protein JVT61DRAFT_4144 [Boletus reticuloceps]